MEKLFNIFKNKQPSIFFPSHKNLITTIHQHPHFRISILHCLKTPSKPYYPPIYTSQLKRLTRSLPLSRTPSTPLSQAHPPQINEPNENAVTHATARTHPPPSPLPSINNSRRKTRAHANLHSLSLSASRSVYSPRCAQPLEVERINYQYPRALLIKLRRGELFMVRVAETHSSPVASARVCVCVTL